jgi:two-component sensor histidine kinase
MSWGQATAVTLVSAITANYLFMEPRFTFLAEPSDTIGTLFFVIAALMIVAVGQTLRRAVRQLEESRNREAHLNRELQHRVKNTLAVVQGLASQTFRGATEVGPALDKLQSRIRALGQANDILRDGSWEECHLPDLAVRALEPFNARGAITLAGPHCILPEESCVPLVLSLHELATNAVKHGSLSSDVGTVELTWEAQAERPHDLNLHWTERGGPAVSPPHQFGLGAKLLRPQPGLADVSTTYAREGVRCDIRVTGVRELEAGAAALADAPPATIYTPTAVVPV